MQNIGVDNAGDAFYRYKMPKLVAKVRRDAAPMVLCTHYTP
jgi:hypothetical protein